MNGIQQEHPAFPQPEDAEQILWRYMDGDKFFWLVKFRRLFFAPVELLDDPLEGTAPEGELRHWAALAARARTKKEKDILAHNRRVMNSGAEIFRERYFVNCWRKGAYESKAMWAAYTNSPEAVAIKTNYRVLRECLPDYIFMGVVRYIDYLEDKLPDLNLFHLIMHKDNFYDFESEVRAVAFYPAVEGENLTRFLRNQFEFENQPGRKVHAPEVNISALITEIVLHPEVPTDFQQTVIKICRENGLPTPIVSRRYLKTNL